MAFEWPLLFLWPLALAYLFPDGRLPSPRWRPFAGLVCVVSAGLLVLILFAPEIETRYGDVPNPLPFTWPRSLEPVFWVFWGGLLVSLFGGVFALFARYRSGDRRRRRQVLWLAYGALLVPIWLGGGSLLTALTGWENPADFLGILIIQIWPAVAVWIAVTRHGLYSIDRLLNRTLVYVALTVLLVATYALVSLGAGLVVGGSAATASIATLAAALVFRPLHDRVQRVVDRRFARARFDAVRLLREFLDEVRDGRAEPEDVGEAVALALGDPRAEVVFRLPETGAYADRLGHVLEALPEDDRARAVIGRDDRELGLLLHDPALNERPDLLRAVLAAAAVPVELARLRVELRLQLAEVESSRARIAQAGYAERRRIERDLHDGAQQRLVTLGIVLRRIQRSLPRGAMAARPGARRRGRRGHGRDRRPAHDRRRRAAAAAGRGARRRAGRPRARGGRPGRGGGQRGPRAAGGGGRGLLRRLRGADERAQARGAEARACRDRARERRAAAAGRRRRGRRRRVAGGTGLPGMRDRVAAQGGTLAIDSPPGAGTRIAVQLPCAS